MSLPIQSTKYPDYYKLPPLTLGVEHAPWRRGAQRLWGRRSTIEFLLELGKSWDFSWNPYDKFVQSMIYIGDISPEGGAHPQRDPVKDHATHKNGHDIDIFFVRNDGLPKPTTCLIKDQESYDLEQNIKLAKMMVRIARKQGLTIGFFYGNDKRVQKEVPQLYTFTNHEDHFHINLCRP